MCYLHEYLNNVYDLVVVARDNLVNNGASRGGVAGIRGYNGDYKGVVGYGVEDRVLAVLLALLDAYTGNNHTDNQSDTTNSSANYDADRNAG